MRKKLLVGLLLTLPLTMWAGGDDDFGVWTGVSVSKNLPRNWSVGVEAELRTEDNVSKVDRWSVGVELDYRLNKYLKLGASYSLLDKYTSDKTKYKDPDDDDEWTTGYNYYKRYWTPRHRASFELNAGVKLWKWLRISVRERYQFTHTAAKDVERLKYREIPGEAHLVDFVDGQPVYKYDDPEISEKWDVKHYDGSDSHYLRSRLKLEYDRKRCDWTPFVSVEFQNSLTDAMSLHKVRAMAGTEYKISKHHSVMAAYVFTCETDDGNARQHAVSVGYGFEF